MFYTNRREDNNDLGYRKQEKQHRTEMKEVSRNRVKGEPRMAAMQQTCDSPSETEGFEFRGAIITEMPAAFIIFV